MERILIIGNCGAGKTTLSRKLQSILGLEVIHLDQHYWKPYWTEPYKLDWTKTVSELVKKESWIMDGNYGGTMDMRLEKADTIIYLNFPTIVCLSRVIKRIFSNWGKVRYEMPEGCFERLDLKFLRYVAMHKITRGKYILKKLKLLDSEKEVLIFKNDKEVTMYLDSLKHFNTDESNINYIKLCQIDKPNLGIKN
jgi:adenylate kinase family enzyme